MQTTGNVSLGNLDFGNKKVVLIVNGDANITGNINFTDGTGFFGIIATGNINIDSGVGSGASDPDAKSPNLEGVYFAKGSVNTGGGANQIRIDGSVVGMTSVNLQRSGVSQYPSEYFVYKL